MKTGTEYDTVKHEFEPLPTSSVVCRYCKQGVTDTLHQQITGERWATREEAAGTTMTIGQVKEFQKAIGTAAWKLDLWKLAEVLGSNADHDWTKEKFKQLSELSRAVSRFDPETLARIINSAEEGL